MFKAKKKLQGELVILVIALSSKQHIGGGWSKFRRKYLAEFVAYGWFGVPEGVFSLMSKSIKRRFRLKRCLKQGQLIVGSVGWLDVAILSHETSAQFMAFFSLVRLVYAPIQSRQ